MKNVLLIVILALSTALFSQRNGPYIDPILEKDVNLWIADAEKYNVNWKRVFYKFDTIKTMHFPFEDVLGYCDDYSNTIVISKTIIDDPFLLKFVVYHELGNCILDYNHICDRMAIMNPAINFYPIELYQQMWDRLVEDFFDKNRGIQCPELRITENQVEPELVLPNIQICPH